MDSRANGKTKNYHANAKDQPLPKRSKCRLDPATKVQSWLLGCSPMNNCDTTMPSISRCITSVNALTNIIITIPDPPSHSVTDVPADEDSSVDTTQYIKSNRRRMHNKGAGRHRRRTNKLQKLRDRPADDSMQVTIAVDPSPTSKTPVFPSALSTVDQVVPYIPYGCAMAATLVPAAAAVPQGPLRPFYTKRHKLRTRKQLNACIRPHSYASSSVSSSSSQEQSTGVRSAEFRTMKAATRPKRKKRPTGNREKKAVTE